MQSLSLWDEYTCWLRTRIFSSMRGMMCLEERPCTVFLNCRVQTEKLADPLLLQKRIPKVTLARWSKYLSYIIQIKEATKLLFRWSIIFLYASKFNYKRGEKERNKCQFSELFSHNMPMDFLDVLLSHPETS